MCRRGERDPTDTRSPAAPASVVTSPAGVTTHSPVVDDVNVPAGRARRLRNQKRAAAPALSGAPLPGRAGSVLTVPSGATRSVYGAIRDVNVATAIDASRRGHEPRDVGGPSLPAAGTLNEERVGRMPARGAAQRARASAQVKSGGEGHKRVHERGKGGRFTGPSARGRISPAGCRTRGPRRCIS